MVTNTYLIDHIDFYINVNQSKYFKTLQGIKRPESHTLLHIKVNLL